MDPTELWRVLGAIQQAMAAAQAVGRGPGAPHGGGPDAARLRQAWARGPMGWDSAWRFGFGGPRRGRARRGDVRAAILAMLLEKPMNGYQIMQALEEKSQGRWRPSPGAVYPALQQLEDEGLIRAEASDGASGRVFHLTTKGQKLAATQPKDDPGANPWDPPGDADDDDERAARVDDGLALAKLLPALVQPVIALAQGGSPAQIKAARRVLKDAKKALYAILAHDDSDEGEAAVDD